MLTRMDIPQIKPPFQVLASAKKDIFAVFAYEFELLLKMIYRLRDMIYGLCRMIYLLRKHDIISVPSYAKRISSAKQIS